MQGFKNITRLMVFMSMAAMAGWTSICFAKDIDVSSQAIRPLANDYVEVWHSPDPVAVSGYTPSLAILPSGRLIVTTDIWGKNPDSYLEKTVGKDAKGRLNRSLIYTSDDRGKTWKLRGGFPFQHARPFMAGSSLYILGQNKNLMVIRSDDEGVTWTTASTLTEGQVWHQSACSVVYANNCVYLTMEHRVPRQGLEGWAVANIAPVLMRGKIGDDLTQRENWTFASELVFEDVVDFKKINYLPIPFYPSDARKRTKIAGEGMSPIGWLESNVVQVHDPDHLWFDATGHTFHLFLRTHTGTTNFGAVLKVVENPDGTMTTQLVETPSGKEMVYLPFPGGQMRFHILYDDKTKLYWMLGSQATYSMYKPELKPAERYGLPDNERHRMVLHFSRDLVNWCFAGLVAEGPSPKQSRHYGSMVIDGDDLLIVSRSGDENNRDAHNCDMITFHVVNNFRGLVY